MTFRTIPHTGTVEITISKSRFIGIATPVTSELDARAVIEATRKAYWNANHTCSAWRIGEQGELERTNDDGEPAGSAGAPIGSVLRGRDVTNLVITVTRYFGGSKLGVGGLIRAYGEVAASAIGTSGIVELQERLVIALDVTYDATGAFEHALRGTVFPPTNVTYNETGAVFELAIEEEQLPDVQEFASRLSSGTVSPRQIGTLRVAVPVTASGSSDD